jgi:hypothetical protein
MTEREETEGEKVNREFLAAHQRFQEMRDPYFQYSALKDRDSKDKLKVPFGSIEARLRYAKAFYEWHERSLYYGAVSAMEGVPADVLSKAMAEHERAQREFLDLCVQLKDGAYQAEENLLVAESCVLFGKSVLHQWRLIESEPDYVDVEAASDEEDYLKKSRELTEKRIAAVLQLFDAGLVREVPGPEWHSDFYVEGVEVGTGRYILTGLGFALTVLVENADEESKPRN